MIEIGLNVGGQILNFRKGLCPLAKEMSLEVAAGQLVTAYSAVGGDVGEFLRAHRWACLQILDLLPWVGLAPNKQTLYRLFEDKDGLIRAAKLFLSSELTEQLDGGLIIKAHMETAELPEAKVKGSHVRSSGNARADLEANLIQAHGVDGARLLMAAHSRETISAIHWRLSEATRPEKERESEFHLEEYKRKQKERGGAEDDWLSNLVGSVQDKINTEITR